MRRNQSLVGGNPPIVNPRNRELESYRPFGELRVHVRRVKGPRDVGGCGAWIGYLSRDFVGRARQKPERQKHSEQSAAFPVHRWFV